MYLIFTFISLHLNINKNYVTDKIILNFQNKLKTCLASIKLSTDFKFNGGLRIYFSCFLSIGDAEFFSYFLMDCLQILKNYVFITLHGVRGQTKFNPISARLLMLQFILAVICFTKCLIIAWYITSVREQRRAARSAVSPF